MMQNCYTVTYDAVHPGSDNTAVFFYDRIADALSAASEAARILFVTDTTVSALPPAAAFFSAVQSAHPGSVLILESGETHKTIENVLRIVKTALENGLQRSDTFVGIGGGVICDMTAFAASIFKRGAKLELVPTTVLAMVDASLGGKTGCDFDAYKNMIGSFYPAAKLHIAPQFASFLPEHEYRSGLAEVLKTALLYNAPVFQRMKTDSAAFLAREPELLAKTIMACVQAKGSIVEQDLTEKGKRMQLNFGHTFGHALETCCGLGNVSHGEAVAWGIGRALELSVRLGLCPPAYQTGVFQVLAAYGWCTSPRHPALPAAAGAAELIAAMHKDKKNDADRIRCILQKNIEDTVIQEVPESDLHAVLA